MLACETNGFLGGKAALTNPAKSNFLSFNEGWSEALIKYPLIMGFFMYVCETQRERERERVCVYALMKGYLTSSIFLDKLGLLNAVFIFTASSFRHIYTCAILRNKHKGFSFLFFFLL